MRVALVCPYAWNRFGGVQSHVRALATALRRRGHEVTVVAPRTFPPARRTLTPSDEAPGPVTDDVAFIGRTVSIPANGSVAPVAFGPVAASGVRRALRAIHPEVVHLHEPLIPSLSLLALLNTRAPTVGTFHAAAEASLAYWASRPVLRGAADRITVRTVVSDAALALIGRYFPAHYETTPNGVDVRHFAGADPIDLGAARTVLFFGRIERRKGLEILIQAMTRLRDLDVKLVIAGSGPEGPACRALAARLKVEVAWLGPPHDDAKAGIYGTADVYCAPNTGGESFGIVLIEAMAAGAPVVCTDLPGFRAVAERAALLVRPDDAGALADGLRVALTDRRRAAAMSAAGREVAERFDWAQLSARIEDLYETAARKHAAAPGRGSR